MSHHLPDGNSLEFFGRPASTGDMQIGLYRFVPLLVGLGCGDQIFCDPSSGTGCGDDCEDVDDGDLACAAPVEIEDRRSDRNGHPIVAALGEIAPLVGFEIVPPWKKGSRKIIRSYNTPEPDNTPGHINMDYYALDFKMPIGTAIFPVAPGRVKLAGKLAGGWSKYGWVVLVDHDNDYYSLYAHLREVKVSEGTPIWRTSKIGTSGDSGLDPDREPHLHLAIYKDARVMQDADGNWGPVCAHGSGSGAQVCAVKPEPFAVCLKNASGDACSDLDVENKLYRPHFKYSKPVLEVVGTSCLSPPSLSSSWKWTVSGLPPSPNVKPVRLSSTYGGVWQSVAEYDCPPPHHWRLKRLVNENDPSTWSVFVAQYPEGSPSKSDRYTLTISNGMGFATSVDWE
jgi:murein DD-endopeptidase MepM/ murein hydrolase activator NlpD